MATRVPETMVTEPVGKLMECLFATPPTNWLELNGDTVGSASSGATQAHADYQTLFELLWNELADTEAPVGGGRGASANADWTANKTITLPDARGCAIIGAGTGSYAGATARIIGDFVGSETHTLVEAEIPAHTHEVESGAVAGREGSGGINVRQGSANVTSQSTGGGGAHANMQPSLVAHIFIKAKP